MYYIARKDTGRWASKGYHTERSAKAVMTRKDMDKNIFEIVDGSLDPMVERVNLMTGKKYQERLNTPVFCSPASESYYSM